MARGFASMSPEKQREIASKGGRAAHEQGRAHEFTPSQARAAGKKGGETIAQDREHMAAIGRAGGVAAGIAKRERARLEAEKERDEKQKKELEERWGKQK